MIPQVLENEEEFLIYLNAYFFLIIPKLSQSQSQGAVVQLVVSGTSHSQNGFGHEKYLQKLQLLFPQCQRFSIILKYFFHSPFKTQFSTDPRSEDWYLLETPPTSILFILIGYVIVTKHGPKFMEMRKPYELKFIMMIYNFFQVVSNLSIGIYVSSQTSVNYFPETVIFSLRASSTSLLNINSIGTAKTSITAPTNMECWS